MNKKIYIFTVVGLFVLSFLYAQALTKPGSDADIENLSYVFYLYYDHGQLFADRDQEIKYDIITEKYVAPPSSPTNFKGTIITFKSVTAAVFEFDPAQGNSSFTQGKIQVKAPYVSDANQATFNDPSGNPVLNIFVNAGSVCNDDGVCTEAEGENLKTCANDCKQARPSPTDAVLPSVDDSYDLNTILIYAVGGLGIALGAWFGWKWWKKKRGESFLPPAAPPSSSALFPPPPPLP